MSLCARWLVLDRLLHCLVDLFGREQRRGLRASCSGGSYRERNRGSGHMVWQIRDDERVMLTQGKVLHLEPSTDTLHRLLHGLTPCRSAGLHDAPGPFQSIGCFDEVLRHGLPPLRIVLLTSRRLRRSRRSMTRRTARLRNTDEERNVFTRRYAAKLSLTTARAHTLVLKLEPRR